jgi:hypothetical protein
LNVRCESYPYDLGIKMQENVAKKR